MKPKDFSPYELIAETQEAISFKLRKGNRILFFATFRVVPLLLLVFCAFAPEDIRRTLPPLLYWGLYMSVLAVVLASVFYRYTSALTITQDSIILRLNLCFFEWNEIEYFNPDDEILIAKEQGGRSVYWMFYLIRREQKKKKLFHIPASFTENLESRNNFIAIFEQRYDLKTTVQS